MEFVMVWIVKSRNPNGSVNQIRCDTPQRVIEILADQRSRGMREVWIEDSTGKRVDEASFKTRKTDR
jgi:hypothetical protein